MRNRIVELVRQAALERPEVVFVTGDLGFSVVETIQATIGDRFINAGIAEQNMVTMSAALSFCGLEPYVYTITPFVTARSFEQVRNDVCYHNARVRLIGNGAGFAYGSLGATHHALEDATVMAALPEMTVFSPASNGELDRLFELSDGIAGPIYYRIGRETGPDGPAPAFDLERPVATWIAGSELNIVTSGSIAGEAFSAAQTLVSEGLGVRLVTVPILSPFPAAAVLSALAPAPTVLAFEGYAGNPLEAGLAVAMAEAGWSNKTRFLNAGTSFARTVGTMDFQRTAVGLDRDTIVRTARTLF